MELAKTHKLAISTDPPISTHTGNTIYIAIKLQTNLRPQLPTQPNPNPNNRPVQSIQIIETPEIETDLRECNDLQLRSGRIIEIEGDKTAQVENQLPIEQPLQEEDVIRQETHNQVITSSPPFPERLIIP